MVEKTRTLIWDFIDLENPAAGQGAHGRRSRVRSQSVRQGRPALPGELPLRACAMLSIKDPMNPKEIAFFDTDPFRPNTAGFNGAWNVFPFFKSGTIIVSSIEQGLFIDQDGGQMMTRAIVSRFSSRVSARRRSGVSRPDGPRSPADVLYVCVQDDAKVAVVDMAAKTVDADDRPARSSASPPPPSRTTSSSSPTARTGTCRSSAPIASSSSTARTRSSGSSRWRRRACSRSTARIGWS